MRKPGSFYVISHYIYIYICYKHFSRIRIDKVLYDPDWIKQVERPKFNFEEMIMDGNNWIRKAFHMSICIAFIS